MSSNLLRMVERHQMLFISVASAVFLSGLFAVPLRFGTVRAVAEVEVPRSTGCGYPAPIIGPDLQPLALAHRDPSDIGEWAELASTSEFRDSVARRAGDLTGPFTLEAKPVPGSDLLTISGVARTREEVIRVVDAAAGLLQGTARKRAFSQQAVWGYMLGGTHEPGKYWMWFQPSAVGPTHISSLEYRDCQLLYSRNGVMEPNRRVVRDFALQCWEMETHPERFVQQPLRVVSWAQVEQHPRGPLVALLWLALSTLTGTAAAALRDRCRDPLES